MGINGARNAVALNAGGEIVEQEKIAVSPPILVGRACSQ
jgi:hypothetical protein